MIIFTIIILITIFLLVYLYIGTMAVQFSISLFFSTSRFPKVCPEKKIARCAIIFFCLKNTLWKRNCEIFNTSPDLVKYLHAFDNNASYQFDFYGVVTNELLSFLAWLSFNISHFFILQLILKMSAQKGVNTFNDVCAFKYSQNNFVSIWIRQSKDKKSCFFN